MKKILVPTDFSEYALNATKLAAQIAKKNDATLYLLHIVAIPFHETGNLPHQSAQSIPEGIYLLKLVKQRFEALKKADFLKDIRVIEAIQMGGVFESLNIQVEKNNIDLIVMGTHGTSGYFKDTFIGNVTDKVIRNSKIPVISLRNEALNTNFKNIVFASDFNSILPQQIEKITSFINAYDATVHLVRIATNGDFETSLNAHKNMNEFAQNAGIKNYTTHLYNALSVQVGINEFSSNVNADLIITPTKGRAGLALLLNGSLALDIIKEAAPPVMTIKIS